MAGVVADLARLLGSLAPVRHPGAFGFCELPAGEAVPAAAVGWFREAEGVTVIVPVAAAHAAGLAVRFEAAWITLSAHSDLAAVGLTAAVSAALAAAGVSCNVVAAVRHDHLFVPHDRGADALVVLRRLQAEAEPGAAADGGA